MLWGSSPKLSELAGPKAQLAEAFEVKMFKNTRHRTLKKKWKVSVQIHYKDLMVEKAPRKHICVLLSRIHTFLYHCSR